MMSFNSGKIGGPAGIAILYKKRDVNITNIYGGGDQEFGFRPGTINPMLAYGFAIAANILKTNKSKNENKYIELKKYFIENLFKIGKDENFVFVENSSPNSISSIVSISFPYFSGQQFAIELDMRGVAVSSKSACNTKDDTESYVIKQIRKSSSMDNWGTIRISFSPQTQKTHINKLLKEIKNIVRIYRSVLY
jgi:cysteine desulfurase